MAAEIYGNYKSMALKPFAEKLRSDYYNAIATSCGNAKKQCEKIQSIERQAPPLQYASLCAGVIADIEKHVSGRMLIHIPYLHKLSAKVADSHDCSQCSGGCRMAHDMHITELSVTNAGMSKALSRLHMATLPLYSETCFPDEYRVLRSAMTILETNLTELFFLERNYLVPKIAEAQGSINAGSK